MATSVCGFCPARGPNKGMPCREVVSTVGALCGPHMTLHKLNLKNRAKAAQKRAARGLTPAETDKIIAALRKRIFDLELDLSRERAARARDCADLRRMLEHATPTFEVPPCPCRDAATTEAGAGAPWMAGACATVDGAGCPCDMLPDLDVPPFLARSASTVMCMGVKDRAGRVLIDREMAGVGVGDAFPAPVDVPPQRRLYRATSDHMNSAAADVVLVHVHETPDSIYLVE